MGLLTAVLTLPIAPVNGVVWIGRRILDAAEAELDERERVSRELSMLREDVDQARITPEMYSAAETALLDSLISTRDSHQMEETHGKRSDEGGGSSRRRVRPRA